MRKILLLVVTILLICTLLLSMASFETRATSNTILFETGFESDPVLELAFNGSLPKGSPAVPSGWSTVDDDAFYNNGTITGPARIWILHDPSNAHSGDVTAMFSAGQAGILGEWDMIRYCLLLKSWWENDRTPTKLNELYVRWYQKFAALPSSPGQSLNIFNMLGIEYSGSAVLNDYTQSAVVRINVDNNNTRTIGFNKIWNNGITTESPEIPVSLATNRWYSFEVWYKSDAQNGEYKLWIDGAQVLSITGIDSTPSSKFSVPYAFEVGLSHSQRDPSTSYVAWVDDVVAANYRVGPEGWHPSGTLTIPIRVTDSVTGKGIPNALVKVGEFEGRTDQSGAVTLEGIPQWTPYAVSVTVSGYRTITQSVSLTDTSYAMEFRLVPIPAGKGSLVVDATKKNASVSASVEVISNLDNTAKGSFNTPFATDLDPGTYLLRAKYRNQTLDMLATIAQGQTSIVTVEFPPQNGTLLVKAFAASTEVTSLVTIWDSNGVLMTVNTPVNMTLIPMSYTLEARYGQQTVSQNVIIEEGLALSLEFQFEENKLVFPPQVQTFGLVFVAIAILVGLIFVVREVVRGK